MSSRESKHRYEHRASSLSELLSAHEQRKSGFAYIENPITKEEDAAVKEFFRHPILRYRLGSYSRYHPFDFSNKKPRFLTDHFSKLRKTVTLITDDEHLRAQYMAGLSVIERDILHIESASSTPIFRLRQIYRRPRLMRFSGGQGHYDEVDDSNIFLRSAIRNFSGPATRFDGFAPPDGSTTHHWGAVYHWESSLPRAGERCALMMELGGSTL